MRTASFSIEWWTPVSAEKAMSPGSYSRIAPMRSGVCDTEEEIDLVSATFQNSGEVCDADGFLNTVVL